LGFSLAEIKQAVALNNHGIPWQVVSQLIAQKLLQINEDILLLEQKRELLQSHQAAIQACLVDNPD
jgi:DNA-binding transcriptional MerR regulator